MASPVYSIEKAWNSRGEDLVEEEDCTGEDLTSEKGLTGEASRDRGSRKRQGHMRAWGR
jgi:hypothetical protein